MNQVVARVARTLRLNQSGCPNAWLIHARQAHRTEKLMAER